MLTEDFKLASFCLTEPDAGSDVSGMRTTAVRKGDKYVINGSKCFITNGGYADWYTVYAKTDKEAGHRGISCFLVPRDDTVTVDKKEDKMGQRASNTATITFNETEIPADHLIGEENKGFKLAMMTLDRTRPGVAAMATGIARAAFEFATNYSKERVQFGVPIAMHQAIQFMIADMATKVHLSRLATWNSAVLLDQGSRNTIESSHAKRFAADTAMEVTTDAVQVYGGYGFIKDYPVEKLMRDAKIMQLYEGTSQIQRLVIARETLLPRRDRGARARGRLAYAPARAHRTPAARRAPPAAAPGTPRARRRARPASRRCGVVHCTSSSARRRRPPAAAPRARRARPWRRPCARGTSTRRRTARRSRRRRARRRARRPRPRPRPSAPSRARAAGVGGADRGRDPAARARRGSAQPATTSANARSAVTVKRRARAPQRARERGSRRAARRRAGRG